MKRMMAVMFVAGIFLCARPCPADRAPGSIGVTSYPPWANTTSNLEGSVSGIDPLAFKMLWYLRMGPFWPKPYADSSVPLRSDGRFTVDLVTGGADEYSPEYAGILVPQDYIHATGPGPYGSWTTLPAELLEFPNVSVRRPFPGNRRITFSGFEWIIKQASKRVGPGDNLFSDSPDLVHVDPEGRLHLNIAYTNVAFWCSEVVCTSSLGYGTYEVVIESPVNNLDPNVVLSPLFIWDDYSPETAYREIDAEVSSWGQTGACDNCQFVRQPFTVPLNIHRFRIDKPGPTVVRIRWENDRIEFEWAYAATVTTPEVMIERWVFTNRAAVPTPGTETARINLWLCNPAMAQGTNCEIILRSFRFTPSTNNAPVLEITSSTNTCVRNGSGELRYAVTNSGGGQLTWTASVSNSWLHLVAGSSGTNEGCAIVTYEANKGTQREGYVWFSAPDAGGSPVKLRVFQDAAYGPTETKLLHPEQERYNFHGRAVGCTSNRLFVGCPGDASNAGSVVVYRIEEGTGAPIPEAKLTASDPTSGAKLGWSLKAMGDYIIVGAPGFSTAYLFKRDSSNAWTQVKRFASSSGQTNSSFGVAVDMDEHFIFIAGEQEDSTAGTDSGAVDIYRRGEDDSIEFFQRLSPPQSDPSAYAFFGSTIAVRGNRIVLGARNDGDLPGWRGAAWVFELEGGSFVAKAKIGPPASGFRGFGSQSAWFDDDTFLVSAPGDGNVDGTVFEYKRVAGGWVVASRINAPAGLEREFGSCAAVVGRRAIVGSPNAGASGRGGGTAIVFSKSGTNWLETARIRASDARPNDRFGSSVAAVRSDGLLIGAPQSNNGGPASGCAYLQTNILAVETRPVLSLDCSLIDAPCTGVVRSVRVSNLAGTGTMPWSVSTMDAWISPCPTTGTNDGHLELNITLNTTSTARVGLVTITAAGAEAGTQTIRIRQAGSNEENLLPVEGIRIGGGLGWAVSLGDQFAVVGEPKADDTGNDSGVAWLYERTQGRWVLKQKLTAPDGTGSDAFGSTVKLGHGGVMLVGAPRKNSRGAVYVSTLANGIAGDFRKLSSSSPSGGRRFGSALGLNPSGTVLVVGDPDDPLGTTYGAGSASVYLLDGTNTTLIGLLRSPEPAASQSFGSSVAVGVRLIVVGARNDGAIQPYSGCAYVFQNTNGAWTNVIKIKSSAPLRSAYFGSSVDVWGDVMLAVGAPGDSANGSASGAVTIFRKTHGQWIESQTLAMAGSPWTWFGQHLALRGTRLAVGGYGGRSPDWIGLVRLYEFDGSTWCFRGEELHPYNGNSGDSFGWSLSLSSVGLGVGAPNQDGAGTDEGGWYFFDNIRPDTDDVDADGLPDWWELYHFGSLSSDGDGDVDFDGSAERLEYRAGTDPTDPGDVFSLEYDVVSNRQLRVSWPSLPGGTYLQQKTWDLVTWEALQDPRTGTGAKMSATIPFELRSAFLRVVQVTK